MESLYKNKKIKLHSQIRIPEAELIMAKTFITLAEKIGFRLHITHVSNPETIDVIEKSHHIITTDVTIHHLLLNNDIEEKIGYLAKVNPPLRSEVTRQRLYNYFIKNKIDAIISDHAPHSLEEKLNDNYEFVPPGFPGVELVLHLLMTEIIEGRLPLNAIEYYSSKPASIIGIKRGKISLGYYADFTIYDVKQKWKIKGSNLVSKAKYTPFENQIIKGKVSEVFIRGTKAYENEVFLVNPGFGIRWKKVYE
ncbi:MAG TPA: hypothetical protein ENF42_00625 [Candidatus Bathyarchaeota archaeon]|nr:hypothetical protein [Candidatus Bathyarchaeota archaeon]